MSFFEDAYASSEHGDVSECGDDEEAFLRGEDGPEYDDDDEGECDGDEIPVEPRPGDIVNAADVPAIEENLDPPRDGVHRALANHDYSHERVNPLGEDRHKKKPLILITLGRIENFGDPECKRTEERDSVKHPWWVWKLKDGVTLARVRGGRIVRETIKIELKWYIVAREKHADGTGEHYHIATTFTEPVRRCDLYPIMWELFPRDMYGGCPNITAFNSVHRLGSYLVCPDKDKDVDPEPMLWNVPEDWIKKWRVKVRTDNKFKAAAAICKKTREWYEAAAKIDEDEPGFLLQNLKRVKEYHAFEREKEMYLQASKLGELTPRLDNWREYCGPVNEADVPMIETVIKWFRENVGTRKHRQKQLYMHGGPGVGKTTIWMALSHWLKVLPITLADNEFLDLYEDSYDFVIVDEFTSARERITWMNSFLSGDIMPIKKKGQPVMLKKRPVAVIIVSNLALSDQYRGVQQTQPLVYAAFCDRLIEVDVNANVCHAVANVLGYENDDNL